MTERLLPEKELTYTEHPYIVRSAGICGGRPIINGSRISVRQLVEHYKSGDLIDEIIDAYPHLAPAAVYDAISYYLDHQAEIEQEIVANRLESLIDKYGFSVDYKGFVTFPQTKKNG